MAKQGVAGIAATGDALTAPIAPTRRRRDHSATITFWLFVAPMLIGLGVFTFLPIGWGFLLSLSQARSTINLGEWVGFQNYADILGDARVSRIDGHDRPLYALHRAADVRGLAGAGDDGQRREAGHRVFPHRLLHPDRGLLRRRLVDLADGDLQRLTVRLCQLAALHLRRGAGAALRARSTAARFLRGEPRRLDRHSRSAVVLAGAGDGPAVAPGRFLHDHLHRGLQEIPRSLYEAAWVDGARTGWNTFRYITFPGLRNTSIAVLLLSFIAAFQAFDEFFNILGGTAASSGNQGLARPPLVYLYRVAFTDQDYGRGSAGAFILTALIIGVTLIQGRIFGFGRKA